METYWSHYAKVMEFNRQRILLQNPNLVSYYDIPSRQMSVPYTRGSSCANHLVPHSYNNKNKHSKQNHRNNKNKCFNNYQNKFQRHRKAHHGLSMSESDVTDAGEESSTTSVSKLEFVIDDGFIKFLEISMEHKLNRKKQKAAEQHREKLKQEEELAKGSNLMGVKHKERKEFKSKLYGPESDKIMAMENAMDINFNQQKDLYKPVLWPNIPLNLKF